MTVFVLVLPLAPFPESDKTVRADQGFEPGVVAYARHADAIIQVVHEQAASYIAGLKACSNAGSPTNNLIVGFL